MKSYVIDNSDQGDIKRSITWQYDNAENLIGIIELFKEFYDKSTKDYFDTLMSKFDLTKPIGETPGEGIDYGLSVWGKILGMPRPFVTVSNVRKMISSEFYRRILLAKLRLLSKDATVPNYIAYVNDMFGIGNVTVFDGKDMSLKFVVKSENSLSDEERAAITQIPDVIFTFPSGVMSSGHSDSLILGLSTNGTSAQDTFCGGFDESSFCWRYTPKGNWTK